MGKIKYLSSNISLINITFFIVILLMIGYAFSPLFNTNIQFILPSTKDSLKQQDNNISETHMDSLNPSEYIVISDMNLFHPERTVPPEKKEEEAPPLPKPDILLYGTLISDDVKLAYVEDLKSPRNTPGRGKRQITVKEGDILNGFTLTDVEADKIVMVRGDEKMVIGVRDRTKPKPRETPAIPLVTTGQVQEQQASSLRASSPQAQSLTAGRTPLPSVSAQQAQTARLPSVQTKPIIPNQSQAELPAATTETEVLPPQNSEEQEIFNFINRAKRTQ